MVVCCLTMKQTRVVSTKCTPGFACRAFSDTTLVCFIVNERTTKCSRYIDVPRIFLPRFVTQIFDAGKNLLPWAIMCVVICLYWFTTDFLL